MRLALRTLMLGSALSVALVGPALAQDAATPTQDAPAGEGMHRGHGPMSPDQQLAHMTKALNLTDDQQTQIKPLLVAHQQSLMQLHEDQSTSHEDKRTKMEALNTETHSKIEAILNDTQKAKFEKMMAHREGQWQHGGSEQPQ